METNSCCKVCEKRIKDNKILIENLEKEIKEKTKFLNFLKKDKIISNIWVEYT